MGKNVWPLIIREQKNARLMIVGSRPPEEITSMALVEGIEVLGFVPETAPYLDKAAIAIAPLRYGGGMKGKVNEAMAHGLPVVSTTIGAQGFHAKNGEEMFITDDPEEYAMYVLKLLGDEALQMKMGQAGQRLNETLSSPEVIEIAITRMITLCSQLKTQTAGNKKRLSLFQLGLNRFLLKYYWNKFK